MLSFSVSTSRGARTRRRRKGRTRPGRRGQRSRGCGARIDAARVPRGTPAGRPRTRNAPRARTSRALSCARDGQKNALFRRKTTDTTTTDVVASFSRHIDVTRRSTTRCPGAGTENHHAGRGSGKAPGAVRGRVAGVPPPPASRRRCGRETPDRVSEIPPRCPPPRRRVAPRHAPPARASARARVRRRRGGDRRSRRRRPRPHARGRGGPAPRRRFVDAAARRHRRRHEHELDVILHRDANDRK